MQTFKPVPRFTTNAAEVSRLGLRIGFGLMVIAALGVGLNHFRATKRGFAIICGEIAKFSGDGYPPVSWQYSFVPTGIECYFEGEPAGFLDMGTGLTLLGLVGILCLFASVIANVHQARSKVP